MMLAVVGLLLLVKCTLQQTFTFSQPATGPNITCEGSDVTLQCVILRDGNEVPVDPIWRRNGTLVDTNVLTNHQVVFNSTHNAFTDLVITNVGLEDDNTEYECTAAGANVTSSIVLNVTDPPSLGIITVENTSTTSITISWTSTSVGSVTYNLSLTGDVMMSNITTDTQHTFDGLISDTSYDISVVPSVGMCQGEGKVMVATTDVSTTGSTPTPSVKMMPTPMSDGNGQTNEDSNTTILIIIVIIVVVVTLAVVVGIIIAVMYWKHKQTKPCTNQVESVDGSEEDERHKETREGHNQNDSEYAYARTGPVGVSFLSN